jgi:hypothetical protein
MKQKILLAAGVFFTTTLFAQVPEDALKYSWVSPGGTARSMAVGGASGSLGGDISSLFTNPAGLGFYKTSELVLSPGFSFLNNNSNFRGTNTRQAGNAFNLGATGFVLGFGDPRSKWNSKAFSIALTRTANFNNSISYKGMNDFSSYGEQFAAEVASSNLSLDDVLKSNNISLQSRMAVYSFLADTTTLAGHSSPDVISLAMWDNLKNGKPFLVNQERHTETSGGITELAIGFAANNNDKFYLGGSLGIPIVNYHKQSNFTETDASGNNNNNFNYSQLKETYTTKGVGMNLKIGFIAKPADNIRLGLAIHSPTLYGLTDTYDGSMVTDVENYRPYADKPNFQPHTTTVNVATLTGGQAPVTYKYDLVNPWRIMASGSYVLNEVEDVKRQKGFVTADIEYVNYKSNHYSSAGNTTDNGYYKGVNSAIKDYYKGAFNFRVGGELKFTTLMARLGFAYYGNPYKDSELKGRKMFVSGGLGYRNKGMFVDLAYILGLNRDVNFPYRLPDKANTFAAIRGTGGNIAATVGFKF